MTVPRSPFLLKTLTLAFVKERTLEGLKEALDEIRNACDLDVHLQRTGDLGPVTLRIAA